MSHVIEDVPDPNALLGECRRILTDDGQLTVLTPNIRSWGHAMLRERWLGPRSAPPPRGLLAAALVRAVQSAGFANVECAPRRARLR